MYFSEIKNDMRKNTGHYYSTLNQLLKYKVSPLNDEIKLKSMFLSKKDAYEVILELQNYGL